MTKKTQEESLPIDLAAVARLTTDSSDIAELRRAFTVAREALEDYAEGSEGEECHDRISEYIREYAEERGPFAETAQQALDVDPGNMSGNLQNAYSAPAFLAGLSIAWLMLRGDAR
jgi:hypothetical protein